MNREAVIGGKMKSQQFLIVGFACVTYFFGQWNFEKAPYSDEPGWLIASWQTASLVLQGNFDPDAWWAVNTTTYGNVNPMLPKVIMGVPYLVLIRLLDVPPWTEKWNFRGAATLEENFKSIPSGIHGLVRIIPTVLTLGGIILLGQITLVLSGSGTLSLVAVALFSFNPIVLHYGSKIQTDSYYIVGLLLGELLLLRLVQQPEKWPKYAVPYGLSLGVAACSKVIGVVTGSLMLVLVVEMLAFRGSIPAKSKWTGYILYSAVFLVFIYGTNPQWWPKFSQVSLGGMGHEISEIWKGKQLDPPSGSVWQDLSESSGDKKTSRAWITKDFPHLYNAIGRPLEFPVTFLRFKSLLLRVAALSHHQGYNVSEIARRMFNTYITTRWILPFALLGLLVCWKKDLWRVAGLGALVNIGFTFASMTLIMDRYFWPSEVFLLILAMVGLAWLVEKDSAGRRRFQWIMKTRPPAKVEQASPECTEHAGTGDSRPNSEC